MENTETATSLPPRRNISEIKNKLRRAEAYRQMKRDQKKVICDRCSYYRSCGGVRERNAVNAQHLQTVFTLQIPLLLPV